jgi:hypothetical protein
LLHFGMKLIYYSAIKFIYISRAVLEAHLTTMAVMWYGYGYSRMETISLASEYAVHLGLREQGNPSEYAVHLGLCEQGKPWSLPWLYNFLGRWPQIKVKDV